MATVDTALSLKTAQWPQQHNKNLSSDNQTGGNERNNRNWWQHQQLAATKAATINQWGKKHQQQPVATKTATLHQPSSDVLATITTQ